LVQAGFGSVQAGCAGSVQVGFGSVQAGCAGLVQGGYGLVRARCAGLVQVGYGLVKQVQHVRSAAWRLLWAGPVTVAASVAAVVIVQRIALRMIESPRGSPLTGNEPAIFTAVLVSAAVVVFLGVLSEASNPARTFHRIAFAALILSLLPDMALGLSSVTWASWPLALTFMMMHVVAWAVTVTMLTRLVSTRSEARVR
jgi:hypothetical protein